MPLLLGRANTHFFESQVKVRGELFSNLKLSEKDKFSTTTRVLAKIFKLVSRPSVKFNPPPFRKSGRQWSGINPTEKSRKMLPNFEHLCRGQKTCFPILGPQQDARHPNLHFSSLFSFNPTCWSKVTAFPVKPILEKSQWLRWIKAALTPLWFSCHILTRSNSFGLKLLFYLCEPCWVPGERDWLLLTQFHRSSFFT